MPRLVTASIQIGDEFPDGLLLLLDISEVFLLQLAGEEFPDAEADGRIGRVRGASGSGGGRLQRVPACGTLFDRALQDRFQLRQLERLREVVVRPRVEARLAIERGLAIAGDDGPVAYLAVAGEEVFTSTPTFSHGTAHGRLSSTEQVMGRTVDGRSDLFSLGMRLPLEDGAAHAADVKEINAWVDRKSVV